jgi:hypothetical protein
MKVARSFVGESAAAATDFAFPSNFAARNNFIFRESK